MVVLTEMGRPRSWGAPPPVTFGAMPEITELLTLHALRLRSMCSVEVIATRFDLGAAEVEQVLSSANERNLVRFRDGRLSGWSLTSDGRVFAEGLLAEELERSQARSTVEHLYGRFLLLNDDVLSACTDWQVMDSASGPVVNDHSDTDRDAQTLQRLTQIQLAICPVTDELAGTLNRFGGYSDRLELAHGKVMAGDHEWFTRPTIDSYHTVWFELHEDLLATLGRSRTDERVAAGSGGSGENS